MPFIGISDIRKLKIKASVVEDDYILLVNNSKPNTIYRSRFTNISASVIDLKVTGSAYINGTPSESTQFYSYCNTDNKYIGYFKQDHATGWGVFIQTDNTTTDAALRIDNGTTNNIFRVQSDGKVGVGTGAPDNPLHIYKNATLGSPASYTLANAGLKIQDDSYSMYLDGNAIITSGPFNIGTLGATDFGLFTNGVERINISTAGVTNITGELTCDTHIHQGDNDKHYFGDSDDGEIYHNGTDFININTKISGRTFVYGTNAADATKILFYGDPDAEFAAYYTGDLKLATAAGGVGLTGDLIFTESADHASTPAAGKGYLWVKSDTPSSLIYTDDAGTDYDLTTSSESYMVPIWAEENATLGDNTYEWAFGNGANTPSNNGITIYVPSGQTCTIVAMTATTNNTSGTSVIEADINGVLQGANCNVTISGRSGTNDSFTPVSISNGDRLTFRTTTAGTNSSPSTVCAWLKYVST